jgi:hypothetical protein
VQIPSVDIDPMVALHPAQTVTSRKPGKSRRKPLTHHSNLAHKQKRKGEPIGFAFLICNFVRRARSC